MNHSFRVHVGLGAGGLYDPPDTLGVTDIDRELRVWVEEELTYGVGWDMVNGQVRVIADATGQDVVIWRETPFRRSWVRFDKGGGAILQPEDLMLFWRQRLFILQELCDMVDLAAAIGLPIDAPTPPERPATMQVIHENVSTGASLPYGQFQLLGPIPGSPLADQHQLVVEILTGEDWVVLDQTAYPPGEAEYTVFSGDQDIILGTIPEDSTIRIRRSTRIDRMWVTLRSGFFWNSTQIRTNEWQIRFLQEEACALPIFPDGHPLGNPIWPRDLGFLVYSGPGPTFSFSGLPWFGDGEIVVYVNDLLLQEGVDYTIDWINFTITIPGLEEGDVVQFGTQISFSLGGIPDPSEDDEEEIPEPEPEPDDCLIEATIYPGTFSNSTYEWTWGTPAATEGPWEMTWANGATDDGFGTYNVVADFLAIPMSALTFPEEGDLVIRLDITQITGWIAEFAILVQSMDPADELWNEANGAVVGTDVNLGVLEITLDEAAMAQIDTEDPWLLLYPSMVGAGANDNIQVEVDSICFGAGDGGGEELSPYWFKTATSSIAEATAAPPVQIFFPGGVVSIPDWWSSAYALVTHEAEESLAAGGEIEFTFTTPAYAGTDGNFRVRARFGVLYRREADPAGVYRIQWPIQSSGTPNDSFAQMNYVSETAGQTLSYTLTGNGLTALTNHWASIQASPGVYTFLAWVGVINIWWNSTFEPAGGPSLIVTGVSFTPA